MCFCLFNRLKVSEPRKSLDETDDADESSEDDERSYETPEEKRKIYVSVIFVFVFVLFHIFFVGLLFGLWFLLNVYD